MVNRRRRTAAVRAQITIEYLLLIGFAVLALMVIMMRDRSKIRTGAEDYVNGSADVVVGLINRSVNITKP